MGCHIKRTVPWGTASSYALVSDADSVDTAIVYVHGFLGNAQSTWEQVQYYADRLEGEPFRDADLYFFDYPAEEQFVPASVSRLRDFLTTIYPSPPCALLEAPLRDYDWRLPDDSPIVSLRDLRPYSRLVLVGHSLGAVVIRRLIADEAMSQDDARRNVLSVNPSRFLDAELVLMAPAQIGFSPSGLNGLVHALPFSRFLVPYAAVFRAFQDLTPGCYTLKQLNRETVRMAASHPGSRAFSPRMLWGESEDVVHEGRFDSDPPSLVEHAPGKNHVTVCKLTRDYLQPANIVVGGRAVARGTQ